jgi:hypothetical protein
MTAARCLAAITVKWMQEHTPDLPTVFGGPSEGRLRA